SLGGCLTSVKKPPELPVFAYNAGKQEHSLRVMLSSPGSTAVEGLPRSNTRVLEPSETELMETAEQTDVDITVYFEDEGIRGSTDSLEVRSGTATYSENGYLAVVYDEPIDGEYVHLTTLPENED
ncbi:MAG: hypothetical protein ABEJ22_04845, partial [Haloferacaceae archaeon]